MLFSAVEKKKVALWASRLKHSPVPDCIIIALSKLKLLAEDNLIMAQMVQFFFSPFSNDKFYTLPD